MSATAQRRMWVAVKNARTGAPLADARVEIIAGENRGLWCVTSLDGPVHWIGTGVLHGCMLGNLAQWRRTLRITKPGLRPIEREVVCLPHRPLQENGGSAWESNPARPSSDDPRRI